MRTKSITLYYKVTPKEIVAPPQPSITRKDDWIKDIQRTIPSEWEFQIIKVVYSIHNPEVENMVKFFNGPVVDYYAIQNQDLLSGDIPQPIRKMAREQLLDSVLGYDVKMLNRTTRRRKSSADFTSTQEWNDFLATLRETEFDPNGYEFPDSKQFWELSAKYGYDEAKSVSIQKLRDKIKKLSP